MSVGADLEIAVRELVNEINAAARSRATRGTNILRNTALEVLGHDGSGRVYKNGRVASSPGQPPAPQSGSLRDNWQKLQPLVSGNGGGVRIIMKIRSDMYYAKFLDPGTRYIAQRPYIEPIKQKAKPAIASLFASI